MIYTSILTTVFKYLHHPGCPSQAEFVITTEPNWKTDFSTCTTVYGTRSGARLDASQPATCEAIVRVPPDEGYHSPQAISHRNGSQVFPQVLFSQYQDDYMKDYMFPKQNEWVNNFLLGRNDVIHSFLAEMGSPFIDETKTKRRTAILMVANEGVLDFVLNFICSCKSANIDLSSFVVFLGQKDYVDLIHTMGAKAFYHPSLGTVPKQAAETYADRTFTKIMWMKVTSVYVALAAGFDVIFQDADLVWIKDPVPYLQSQTQYDMIFMVNLDLNF